MDRAGQSRNNRGVPSWQVRPIDVMSLLSPSRRSHDWMGRRMTSRFESPKHKQTRMRPARFTIVGLAALIAAGEPAGATSARSKHSVESIGSRTAGEPIMAIVSLRDQRITVSDFNGWILRAPVSSGQKGRETPAGIFSVIEKKAEHYSNLYDDAYMPHMQRITWSGIALHGGLLPGYPASHGCVRMPFDFAARLFGATRLRMRVIVAPGDVAPVEIAHPNLFLSKPGAGAFAAVRAAEADEAARKADQAETLRRDGLPGGRTSDDAGARGRKSEAQSGGEIGSRRGCSRPCNLGQGKGGGRGSQGEGSRQDR